MINNYPIHPTTLIRYRWLVMLLLLTAMTYMILVQGPAANLNAVEIPMSLLVGPAISATQNNPEKPDQNFVASALNNTPPNQPPDAISFENFEYIGMIDEYYSERIPAGDLFQIDDSFQISERMASFEAMTVNSPENSPTSTDDSEPEATTPRAEQSSPEDPFIPIIMKAARKHKVDPAIIKAIIKAESGYNPKAVSKRGAKGLMQLMPRTAESLGVEDSFCPEQNILGGVKYFKQLLNQFGGDIKLALAAYNAGSRKVRKYKGIPPFRTTRIYIKKVFEYHKEYKQEVVENG